MSQMYDKLSRVGFLSKSYTFKFLFIAFLGIHIPLIGLVIFVLFRPDNINAFTVLLLTLLLTLGATATTLYVMNGLLMPLRRSRQALDNYLQKRELPALPVNFRDEAGILMQNIQFTVTELNDLLEEKKDLASLLSHDLRTPLTNIKLLGDFLKEEKDPEAAKELANLITDASAEQLRLLENILDLLHQDHALESKAANEAVNTNQLVDEMITSFTGQAKEKNISLRKQVDYNGNIEVKPELFKQVMKNLMSNAIKFSYPNSEIKVAVRKTADETQIQVVDVGMGFEPQVSEKIFDQFTKAGRKGTAGESSTGIGLHLSRKIVKRHKGKLIAESKGPDKGSTFTISLYQ